jgi:hypothetical protein
MQNPQISCIPLTLRTATLTQLRDILGDIIEAISQLDMARESGGVVSHEVMSRLRNLLAEPADPTSGGCC